MAYETSGSISCPAMFCPSALVTSNHKYVIILRNSISTTYLLHLKNIFIVSFDFFFHILFSNSFHLYFVQFSIATAKMPYPQHWYCGHCDFGPMTIALNDYCVNCQRQRDTYANYETSNTASIGSQTVTVLPPSTYLDTADPGSLRPATSKIERLSPAALAYQHRLYPDNVFNYAATDQSTPIRLVGQQTHEGPTPAPRKWFCCQCMDTFIKTFFS